ncbi:MAG: hypothetical protein AB4290_20650 [Spirulina sp.]
MLRHRSATLRRGRTAIRQQCLGDGEDTSASLALMSNRPVEEGNSHSHC